MPTSGQTGPTWAAHFFTTRDLLGKFATLEPATAVIRYTGAADATYRQLFAVDITHRHHGRAGHAELTGINLALAASSQSSTGPMGPATTSTERSCGTNGALALDKFVAGTPDDARGRIGFASVR